MRRVLTAVVLIPVVLALVLKGPFWLVTLAAAAVAELATWEYLRLAAESGVKPPRIAVLVCVALLFGAAYRNRDFLGPVITALSLILFVVCAFRCPLERVLADAGASVFAIAYLGFPLITIPLLSTQENGPSLLLLLFFAVWAGDVAALYIGRTFGRHKLAPALSPNKSWEGAFASVLGSILAILFLIWMAGLLNQRGIDNIGYPGPLLHWLFLATLLNVAAQLGDLAESALKRGAGVKDSGSVLPGHGGILDRIDALLFAAPVLWFSLIVQGWF